jgi:hypothetical protein
LFNCYPNRANRAAKIRRVRMIKVYSHVKVLKG